MQLEEKEDSDHEGIEEVTKSSVNKDEQDFQACKMEHVQEFSSLSWIGCFSHTLQLVVNKFDDISLFKELLKQAHSIVHKVNTSTTATERLVALCGKLLKDCPTRWSSTFLMVKWLIDVKDKLKVVLEEQQGWDDLAQASGGPYLYHQSPTAICQIH